MPDPVGWYDEHASELVGPYEAADPEKLHDWLAGLLPKGPASAADIGAGTGRDAAWLSRKGFDVIAVEPSHAMRSLGQARHLDPRIRWIDDQLPELRDLHRIGASFDVITMNAVWQHVPPASRERAFRKVATLLKPGGVLTVTLRLGTPPPDRGMHAVSLDEIERLARSQGLQIEKVHHGVDQQGRSDVSWTCVAMRLPDDGTGALPLLRHIILNDQKSSTYKLGLLRALCRAADSSAGLVREDDQFASVPLGLVALNWLRLYLPLLQAELPQVPPSSGGRGLSFARDGLRDYMADGSARDLRIGAVFSAQRSTALHSALCDAARTIERMPATYINFPQGGRVLQVERKRAQSGSKTLSLRADYLESFGVVRVPIHLWRTLRRHSAWIEPTLIAEWERLMREYARSASMLLSESKIAAAMRWSDPSRDVARVRAIAATSLANNPLHCVWSERRLRAESLDIDHMFPWAAWPCDDLWNLVPAHRDLNQKQKRDRLPSATLFAKARSQIVGWWKQAYLDREESVLSIQFSEEARASLPAISESGPEAVFSAAGLQRIRLRHDQQIPEWDGER